MLLLRLQHVKILLHRGFSTANPSTGLEPTLAMMNAVREDGPLQFVLLLLRFRQAFCELLINCPPTRYFSWFSHPGIGRGPQVKNKKQQAEASGFHLSGWHPR